MVHVVLSLAHNIKDFCPDSIIKASGDATKIACEDYSTAAVYLMVTGFRDLHNNIMGRDRPDWEACWSEGEYVFGEIVKQIGLHLFSPKSEPRLVSKLVSIDSFAKSDVEEKKNCGERWEELSLKQTVTLVCSLLRREECEKVSRVTVVLPDSSQQCFVEDTIEDAFQKDDLTKDSTIHYYKSNSSDF